MCTDICEGCLSISANTTSVVEGDVIMFIIDIAQRPHGGISLSVNGSLVINSDFDCHFSGDSVRDPQVVYHCTARKSGTVIIQATVTLCSVDWSSQEIIITVEEHNDIKIGKDKAAAYTCLFT